MKIQELEGADRLATKQDLQEFELRILRELLNVQRSVLGVYAMVLGTYAMIIAAIFINHFWK